MLATSDPRKSARETVGHVAAPAGRSTSRAPGARGACSSDWALRRRPRGRSGRGPDGCGRAATGRRADASTAHARRPPPSRGSGSAPGAAEVVEGAQHVVVPVVREREVEIRRIDDLAGGLAPEQTALEQVLLCAAARLAHRVGTGRPLELEQPVEHVDRRVERGAHRPVLGLAVPAAVGEPLAEDPLDDRGDVNPEVGAGLDRPAVDARLDLAVEVALTGVLPSPVLGDARDRARAPPLMPGPARRSAGSAGCASSPSKAVRVRRPCRPPESRRRRPTTRRHPPAPAGGRPSPRGPHALARP